MTIRPKAKGTRSGPEEQRLQGHWLLAKMGKTVLRPGGLEMTNALLNKSALKAGETVVEFGPGVGKTAKLLLEAGPAKYVGVDPNPEGSEALENVLSSFPQVATEKVVADAKTTGLPDACADMVIGEAMLTMMSDADKQATMNEAARLLAPGGRYVIHEMGLKPADIDPEISKALKKEISRTIKVGARPLTMEEWKRLLVNVGLEVEFTHQNAMHLLEPKRIIADEGVAGAAKIIKNLISNPAGRKRVLGMRGIFRKYADHLCAVGIIATKPR